VGLKGLVKAGTIDVTATRDLVAQPTKTMTPAMSPSTHSSAEENAFMEAFLSNLNDSFFNAVASPSHPIAAPKNYTHTPLTPHLNRH
jgi:hypothetical protein